MHSNVTMKNVSWSHFSWPTLYCTDRAMLILITRSSLLFFHFITALSKKHKPQFVVNKASSTLKHSETTCQYPISLHNLVVTVFLSLSTAMMRCSTRNNSTSTRHSNRGVVVSLRDHRGTQTRVEWSKSRLIVWSGHTSLRTPSRTVIAGRPNLNYNTGPSRSCTLHGGVRRFARVQTRKHWLVVGASHVAHHLFWLLITSSPRSTYSERLLAAQQAPPTILQLRSVQCCGGHQSHQHGCQQAASTRSSYNMASQTM